jgi:hypothetical protein
LDPGLDAVTALDVLAQVAPEQTLDWLTRGGMIGLLAFGVMGFMREWMIPGKTYSKMVEDRDKWRDLALKLLKATETAVYSDARDRADV